MVGAIVLLPPNAASQKPVVGTVQRVVVARVRARRDAAVHHCVGYGGAEHPDFEVEWSARLVIQFEGVRPEAAPYVAYTPVGRDGQVGIVIDVPLEVYELVLLTVHLACCPYTECGGGLRHPRRA